MIGKLLYLVAFVSAASAALTTNVSIALPTAGANVTANKDMVIQVQVQKAMPAIEDIAIVVAGASCPGTPAQCPGGLGHYVLYTGPFKPDGTNSVGEYQNITALAPSTFVGTMQLTTAYFYLESLNNDPELKIAKTTVNLIGATG